MIEDSTGRRSGLINSLSSLAANLLAIAHTRLELLLTELEDDRQHLLTLILLALVALFCLGVGLVLITILAVMLFREHQLLVLGVLASTYLVAGGIAWLVALKKSRARPRLLAHSLAELYKDQRLLKPRP